MYPVEWKWALCSQVSRPTRRHVVQSAPAHHSSTTTAVSSSAIFPTRLEIEPCAVICRLHPVTCYVVQLHAFETGGGLRTSIENKTRYPLPCGYSLSCGYTLYDLGVLGQRQYGMLHAPGANIRRYRHALLPPPQALSCDVFTSDGRFIFSMDVKIDDRCPFLGGVSHLCPLLLPRAKPKADSSWQLPSCKANAQNRVPNTNPQLTVRRRLMLHFFHGINSKSC